MAELLLILLSAVLLCIVAMMIFIRLWLKKQGHLNGIPEGLFPQDPPELPMMSQGWSEQSRPRHWLAIKSRKIEAVERALDVKRMEVCAWSEGMDRAEDGILFIAPPVNDWILVYGAVHPEPGEDVDACFKFLSDLSAKIGQVQYFQRDPVLSQHAWVKVNYGKVIRAYAWAGETLWNQGRPTPVEAQAGVHCLNYGDNPSRDFFSVPDSIMANVEKVSLIASRWSLDPAAIDETILETERGSLCRRSS